MNKIKLYFGTHKFISFLVLIIIIAGVYFGYKKITSTSRDTRYVTSPVGKGTIVASIAGSGQVSNLNQIDIKAKASGDVIYLSAQEGQKIGAGAVIAELDATDANKAVRDAEVNLESAQISLDKLKVQNSDVNLNTNVVKAYSDGFSSVADTFSDLNATLAGLNSILNTKELSEDAARSNSKTSQDYRDKAVTDYYAANTAFEKNAKDYGILDKNSPQIDIENILKETSDTTKLLSDAIKETTTFSDYMAQHSNNSSVFTTDETTLATYTGTVNGHLSALATAQTNISNIKDSSQNAGLDSRSAQLSIKQKENALQDAKDNLSNYIIRAPFNGTLTKIAVKKADSVSAGTVIATLVTNTQLAEISLNEVDVAKIKIGQKATLTFDAIPDLSITGEVAEIDSIGAVSQGVVTYNVKISFDTQDDRVKSAMSVSAAIITDMKQDILVVPMSAIKSQGAASYVESFDTPLAAATDGLAGSISKIPPTKIPVEVGLSDDSQSEIISGLKEGDEIVTKTILPSSTKTATAPSILGGVNRGGATGGARIPTR